MYPGYTALSAPCPVKKWPPSMGIRIVLTGPSNTVHDPDKLMWWNWKNIQAGE